LRSFKAVEYWMCHVVVPYAIDGSMSSMSVTGRLTRSVPPFLTPLLLELPLAGPAATRRLRPTASMAMENHDRLCTIALLSLLDGPVHPPGGARRSPYETETLCKPDC
jgi:hypothetical protein